LPYPAIPPMFQQEVAAQRLHLWRPHAPEPDFVARRTVLMTQEAWQQCPPDAERTAELGTDMLMNTRAALERFVGGGLLEENVHLKCLSPKDDRIWALRVIEYPQVRVLGWFGQRDIFIASHIAPRAELDKLERGRDAYDRARDKAIRQRDRNFAHLPYVNASDIHAQISHGARDDLDD